MPLTGQDAQWMRAMIAGLHARGVPATHVDSAVAYVEGVCERTRSSPRSQFGEPGAFARRLEFPLKPFDASPGHEVARMLGATRVHYTGILLVAIGISAVLATGALTIALRDGTPTTVLPLAAPLIIVSVLAVVLALTRVPIHVLYRHMLATILGVGALMVAIVVAGVLLPLPVIDVPTPAFFAGTVALGVGSVTGCFIAAGTTRRGGEQELASHLTQLAAILIGLHVVVAVLLIVDP